MSNAFFCALIILQPMGGDQLMSMEKYGHETYQYKNWLLSQKMYKLVIIALLVNLGLCQEFIKESNMWQLDKDSFWKVASRMEVHSVIELYSSDSWCGKFSARPWIWTPCIWNSFSILDDMLCETCVVFSKLLFGPWIRRPLIRIGSSTWNE